MKITQLIFAAFLLAIATLSAAAQAAAYKLDTFGDATFSGANCEDLQARLDNFLATMQNAEGSLGLIFTYDGKHTRRRLPARGEASDRTDRMRLQFEFRQFPRDRYLFVDGGSAKLTLLNYGSSRRRQNCRPRRRRSDL